VVDELVEFFGDANLIAHNAGFDLAFVNAELARIGRPGLGDERVIDTIMLARRKHPGSPASLDALMSRYQIDASRRTLHGALLDAELLAEVYIELIGGRQAALVLGGEPEAPTITIAHHGMAIMPRMTPRVFNVSPEELAAHAAAVAALGAKAIWREYAAA
jgi:DNA polymerase-3 subunit epsilon